MTGAKDYSGGKKPTGNGNGSGSTVARVGQIAGHTGVGAGVVGGGGGNDEGVIRECHVPVHSLAVKQPVNLQPKTAGLQYTHTHTHTHIGAKVGNVPL